MQLKTGICGISKKSFAMQNLMDGRNIRPSILALIKSECPDFTENSLISLDELNRFRKKYLENIVSDEVGELSKIEKEVINSINSSEILSENIELGLQKENTFGENIADKVAEFGGSWVFIIIFFLLLAAWIAINSYVILQKPFDPYPFILLNLVLSCLAAIQAPIIMMSQNRKEDKDRKRSEHDYKINLKAELEIRLLHEKVDHLLIQQNKRFIEIQQIQIDLMEDILDKVKGR